MSDWVENETEAEGWEDTSDEGEEDKEAEHE